MRFCPICGNKREGEEVCSCGYDYSTGIRNIELEKKQDEIVPCLMGFPLDELKRRKIDTGDIKSISYTSSGGMLGSYYNDILSFETNEVTTVDRKWHHAPTETKVFKADANKVKEIKNFLIENNFRAWSELPADRSIIYDALTTSTTIVYEKLTVNISGRVFLTDEEREIFTKLRKMINDLMKDDKVISSKTLETQEQFMDVVGMGASNDDSKKYYNVCPECGNPMCDNNTCECGYKKE